MTKFGFMSLPAIRINKDDSKYLTKIQVKKVQFLFENDYFIWNEAEMYLRYHDIFTSLPNSDILYDNLCRTTRVVFNLIHDTHFSGTGSNAAHLKYFEVLDAWGALSEYIKTNNAFPQPFVDWFDTLFQIYQAKDDTGERVLQCEHFLRLYLKSGLAEEDAVRSFSQISSKKKFKFTFDYLIFLLKQIIISNEPENISYLLVPNLQATLLTDKIEKPPDQVFRNYYDYKQVFVSNNKIMQCDWDKYEQTDKKVENKINHIPTQIRSEFKIVNNNLNYNTQQQFKNEIKTINHANMLPPHLKNEIKVQNHFPQQQKTEMSQNNKTNLANLQSYYKLNTNSILSSPLPQTPLNATTSTNASASQTNTPTSTINTTANINSNTTNSSVDNIENFYKIKNIPNSNCVKESTESNQVFDYFNNKTELNKEGAKNIKLEVLSESSSTSNFNKNSDSSELFEDSNNNKNTTYSHQDESKQMDLKKNSSIFSFKPNNEVMQSRRDNSQYSKFRSKSELGSRNSSFNNSEFKLSEFRREFKTSNIESTQNLSKSINTLDYLGKIANNPTSASVASKTSDNFVPQREKYLMRKNSNRSTSSSNRKNLKNLPQKDSSIYSDLINTSESESLRNRSTRNNKLKKLKKYSNNNDSLKSDKPQLVELKFKNRKKSELNWNDLKKEILIKKLIGSGTQTTTTTNNDLINTIKTSYKYLDESDYNDDDYDDENEPTNHRHQQNDDDDESNDEEDEDDNEDVNNQDDNDSDDDDSDESIHLYSGSLSEKLKQMTHNPTRQDNRENIISKNKIFSSTSLSSSCNSLCSNESIKKIYTDHSTKGLLLNRSGPHSTSISKIYPVAVDELSKSQQSNIKIKSLPLNHPTSFKLNEDPYLRHQMSKSNYRNMVLKKNQQASNNSTSSTNHLQYISNSKLIKANESGIGSTKLGSEDIGDASSASYLVSSIVHNNNNSTNYSLASSKQLTSRQQHLLKLKKKQQQKQQQQSTTNVIAAQNVIIASAAAEEETKSENYPKPVKSKTDRSHGLSEPIKSILDAIVSLSSLDTLNDIDSDEDNDDGDDDDDESIGNNNLYLHHHTHHSNDTNHHNHPTKQKLVEPSDSTIDLNYVDHHLYRYDPNEYYLNNNDNNKILIDQDWSYSLNSTGFSGSDQRLIAEIVRKLKPIINKCVKKEVKHYLDQQIGSNSGNNNNTNNANSNNMKDTTKKNLINQMDKTSLTNIGDF